jgi:UDP-N-acetylmuramoyl-tripeptide--D-alanyl-D-alanine ligase
MISIQDLHALFLLHPGISTDTRNIVPGSIFFALKGGNFNGNKFAVEALEKGAAYAIIDEHEYNINEKTILVKDVLTALQDLAKYHREQLNPVIIAITGSNGKTTTKELMQRVLATQFETLATQGNLNNHIGVPLTLLRLEKKHSFAIIEMGANHRYEIEQLCAIAQPDFGLITNIGKAHLEGFEGETGTARGKTELYFYLYQHHGKAFVNMHEEKTVIYSGHNDCILFSSDKNKYNVATPTALSPQIEFELDGKNYTSILSGEYNFNNILSAVAAGKYFGIEAVKIGEAIASYVPQNLRHQWIEWSSNKVLLDAYNANPDSMYHALKNFEALKVEHKIVVLGDMFELGNAAKDEHQFIINSIEDYDFEEALVCGEFFSAATPLNGVKQFKTFDELLDYFQKQNYQNKTILIKGSRGMKMERLIVNG